MNIRYILFSFDGRIGRREMWLVGLPISLAVLALGVGSVVLAAVTTPPTTPTTVWWDTDAGNASVAVFVVCFAMFLWISHATRVKRAHDLDLSGWWALLPHMGIPFSRGNEGLNRYGFPFDNPRHHVHQR